ncbi:hypothetical protein H6F90_02735 [Trichocoleus sp. FACHB-591]|uniref:hypothetical protein n=1 Tax=Trichocoleus sp. FACHB-591 TaxID=2692872 RepID=UPI0016822436|nr:hypothetical protein [Trichocoleus sp. FACHB-591]MBD2094070.1 hypothetical protein [Trichocoleus sp. FACHB-591]
MRFKLLSQEEFILQNVVELIQSSVERGSQTYSSAVEFGLTELVKEQMRRIAQENNTQRWGDALELALLDVRQKVEKRLAEHNIRFDLKPHLGGIETALKYPGKEVTELRGKLARSRGTNRIGERKRIASEAQAPFEITEVGLQNSIEALIAAPVGKVYELNLEEVWQSYEVEGDWFPFQFVVEELEFVIDDDGTVFISTENFPEKLLVEARETLVLLAERLYGRSASH